MTTLEPVQKMSPLEAIGLAFAHPGRPPLYENLDLQLEPGLHLLLGPNGTGKSSLLRVLAGVERPDAGTVHIAGFDLWRQEVAARSRLAFVPEVPDVTPYATVREILRFVARLRGAEDREAVAAAERLALGELQRRTIRELSLGQRRRVLLAAAWIRTPDLLLLDEPLDGLDQAGRSAVDDWLSELVGRGATVLVSSHELLPFRHLTSTVLWHDGTTWRHDVSERDAYSLTRLEELALGRG